MQLWIRLDQFVVDNVVAVEHFQRKSETYGVHVKGVSDLLAHIGEFTVFETANTVSLSMPTGPVAACDFDSFTGGVDNFHAFSGEWELNSFHIKESGFGLKIFL